jgi:hypothetical protein
MDGATGADIFRFAPGSGSDRINGFDPFPTGGQDLLDLRSFGVTAATFGTRVVISTSGTDTLVTIDGSTIRLAGIARTSISASDFIVNP